MSCRKLLKLGYLAILLLVGLLIIQSVSAEGYWQLTDVWIDSSTGEGSSSGSNQFNVDWNQASETSVQGTFTGDKPSMGCKASIVSLFSWVAPPTILYPDSELIIPFKLEQISCNEKCGGSSDMRVRFTQAEKGTWGLDYFDEDKYKSWIGAVCKNEQFSQSTYKTDTGSDPGSSTDKDRILSIKNRIVSDHYDVNYYYSWIGD